jgi:hypothetical protein
MVDDDNAIEIEFEPPDPDLTYANYLETCRRAGVTRARTRLDRGVGLGPSDRRDSDKQLPIATGWMRCSRSRARGADIRIAPWTQHELA